MNIRIYNLLMLWITHSYFLQLRISISLPMWISVKLRTYNQFTYCQYDYPIEYPIHMKFISHSHSIVIINHEGILWSNKWSHCSKPYPSIVHLYSIHISFISHSYPSTFHVRRIMLDAPLCLTWSMMATGRLVPRLHSIVKPPWLPSGKRLHS